MVSIEFLKELSFSCGVSLLFQEGYIEEECIEEDYNDCDKLFLYPYVLYVDNVLVDRVFHAEYCTLDDDGDYDDFKTCWTKR